MEWRLKQNWIAAQKELGKTRLCLYVQFIGKNCLVTVCEMVTVLENNLTLRLDGVKNGDLGTEKNSEDSSKTLL